MRSNGYTITEIAKEIKMSVGCVKQNYQRTSEHTMKIWEMSVVQSPRVFSRLFFRVKISWKSREWELSETQNYFFHVHASEQTMIMSLRAEGHYSKIWKCFHVNILWKLEEWVLFGVLKYLVHAYSFMWTHCEHLGNEYYPESRTVLFTFTIVNIPWSCSWE